MPNKDPADSANVSGPSETVNGAESGKTKPQQGGKPTPKLPHERDQSSDSQETPDGDYAWFDDPEGNRVELWQESDK